jgi:hypothetical protein
MFTRITTTFILAIFALATNLTTASAGNWKYEPTVQNCEIAYIMNILRQPGHKAVATTGGRPLGVHPTACGFSNSQPTRKAAKEKALAECQKSASKDYPGKCTVIEVQ